MRHWRSRRSAGRALTHQERFAFDVRARRRERWFKRAIVVSTLVLVGGMVAAVPRARSMLGNAVDLTRRIARRGVGMPVTRAEIDRDWARSRQRSVADTRREFERVFADVGPAERRLMSYAGNDPATGVLRWGNFSQTLLLPSTIFAADDNGRSYRLRPNTRAVWLRNVSIQKIPLTFFLVPDGPGLADATKGTSAIRVPGSEQTTNSWGLRGPEPDPSAPLRGIVLGDSFIQGLFIGETETPSECLARELESALKSRASILNTGHLGYSTEQEYFTLREYADRFRPAFVVLNLFANDFGDVYDALQGKGDWEEGKYWIDEIARYCRDRGVIFLTVTAPLETQILAPPMLANYPGRIVNLLDAAGTHHVDATNEFVNAHLRLMIEGEKAGRRPASSPLYNGYIGDGHFSREGSECWARAVGRRLVPLIASRQPDNPS